MGQPADEASGWEDNCRGAIVLAQHAVHPQADSEVRRIDRRLDDGAGRAVGVIHANWTGVGDLLVDVLDPDVVEQGVAEDVLIDQVFVDVATIGAQDDPELCAIFGAALELRDTDVGAGAADDGPGANQHTRPGREWEAALGTA